MQSLYTYVCSKVAEKKSLFNGFLTNLGNINMLFLGVTNPQINQKRSIEQTREN